MRTSSGKPARSASTVTFLGDAFGKDLHRLMQARGVRATDLSQVMDVNCTTIYGWVNGRSLPTVHMLYKLARALDVAPALVLGLVTDRDCGLAPLHANGNHHRICDIRTGETAQPAQNMGFEIALVNDHPDDNDDAVMKYFINAYPPGGYTAGATAAVVSVTKHRDLVVDWIDPQYKDDPAANEVIQQAADELRRLYGADT